MALTAIRPPAARAALPWTVGFCTVVAAICLTVGVTLVIEARREAARFTLESLTDQASAIERDVNAGLADLDQMLRDAARTRTLEGWAGHRLAAAQVGFVEILNAEGDVIATPFPPGPRPEPGRQANYAGRDYFQAQRRSIGDELMIGRPFAIGPGQKPSVPVSRRLAAADGTFAGVVVAGVRLSWLTEVLSRTWPGPRPTMVIRQTDGTILTTLPYDPDAIGRAAAGDPAWQVFARDGTSPAVDESGAIHLFRRLASGLLYLEVSAVPSSVPTASTIWLFSLGALAVLGLAALSAIAFRLRREAREIEAGARRANDERMRLLATMSHELRTPLTGILGQAELMRHEGGLSEAQTGRLTRLMEAGASMRDIVDRVIDVASPENRAEKPEPVLCDLDRLLRACGGVVEPVVRAKGLNLIVHSDPDAPRIVRTDRRMVEQIVQNLLMNAVKFTATGTVELRLSGQRSRIRFEVADTGPGIPPHKRHRLFRAFDRLDAAQSQAWGSGLGLSIVQRWVSILGGEIGYRDNPGGGSLFWVELPVQPISTTGVAAGEQTDPGPPPPPEHGRLRILLVDDLDVTRAVTADFLRAAGHDVTAVEDGLTAVDLAAAQDFDLVLTDMRMPGFDGLETTRQIRALPGDRGRIPVVLVTADLAARDFAASRENGVDLCLLKPFTRLELLNTVARAAGLIPVPATARDELNVLDEAVVEQLGACMDRTVLRGHFESAANRMAQLLALLDQPGAATSQPVRDGVHDLVGITGLLGLSAVSAALRRFDAMETNDRTPALAPLRDALRMAADGLRARFGASVS